jgi:hypothetical protein
MLAFFSHVLDQKVGFLDILAMRQADPRAAVALVALTAVGRQKTEI